MQIIVVFKVYPNVDQFNNVLNLRLEDVVLNALRKNKYAIIDNVPNLSPFFVLMEFVLQMLKIVILDCLSFVLMKCLIDVQLVTVSHKDSNAPFNLNISSHRFNKITIN